MRRSLGASAHQILSSNMIWDVGGQVRVTFLEVASGLEMIFIGRTFA